MSVDTVFYIVGLTLTAGALLVTFAGLKLKSFPSRGALTGVIAVFAALVIATCGLAVAVAREEQDHRRQEQAEAAKLTEESKNPTESDAQSDQAASGDQGATGDEGSTDQASGPGGTLALAADESALAYDKTELESQAGEVTLDFDNPSPIPHDVVIRDDGGEDIAATDVITQSKDSLVADLTPGDYQFYCSVPGHEEAGMVGTLTVTE